MSCACRVSPWRIFVRSLAQVHNIEAAATRRVQPSWTTTRATWTVEHRRQIHVSNTVRQSIADAPKEEISKESSAKPTQRPATDAEHDETSPQAETTNPYQTLRRPSPSMQTERRNRADEILDATSETPQEAENTDARRDSRNSKKPDHTWKMQKQAMKEKFPEGWKPRKRLSPDALAGIRALNAQFPDIYTTQALADKFEVSPEAIRRILKSKWQPRTAEEEQDRQERWFRRGKQVWEHKAALGIKPPKRWRREGVARDADYRGKRDKKVQREREWETEERKRYREVLDANRGIHISDGSKGRSSSGSGSK